MSCRYRQKLLERVESLHTQASKTYVITEEQAKAMCRQQWELEVKAGRDPRKYAYYVTPGVHKFVPQEVAEGVEAWFRSHLSCGDCGSSEHPRLYECSGCQYVVYCGSECQKKAWASHKLQCSYMSTLVGGKRYSVE